MPKKIMYILLVSSIILCITGCGLFKKQVEEREPQLSEEETEQVRTDIRKTVLYFVNEYKMLVPLTRDIPRVEGIGKAAVECLIDNPDSRMSLVEKGLKPPLPEGTRVVGLNIRDGLAKIDFSSGFLNCNDVTAEENAISAVVYTLTEFPAVEQVSIMIEGKPLEKSLHGSVVKEVLQRENINPEPTKSSLKLNDMMPVTLYFKGSSTDGTYNYFVPVTRIVNKSEDIMRTTLQELIKGPAKDSGLVSLIPEGSQLLSVTQEGSEVIVDFSKEVEGYGGGIDTEQALVNSVVITVSQFSGVDKVSILVEGKTGVLPEGTVLDNPILKPLYVNLDNI